MEDITFIIKTFERVECVNRLVKSILVMYPDAIILIGDDSRVSCNVFFEKNYPKKNVKIYDLPFDSGLSYGRNYLLDRIKTDYFVLLDDDFVFDKDTDLESGLMILKSENLDIIGGFFRNSSAVCKPTDYLKVATQELFHLQKPYNYIGTLNLDEANRILNANFITNEFPEFAITDITHNFFIGKTDIIRERNRWDDELKINEHTAFFLKGKQQGLRVGFTNRMSVRHMPIRSKLYASFRDRDYHKLFMRKYNIKKYVITYDGIIVNTIDCYE